MKKRSMFDIIGPVMIGPSSSHTAGALRIAQIASGILQDQVTEADFYLYGSFSETYKGHGTDRALLAGILGYSPDHPDIRYALSIAEQRRVRFTFIPAALEQGMHPNTVGIELKSHSGKELRIVGSSVGGGEVLITSINGIKVEFSGEYPTLIVEQQDRPGVAAHITYVLAESNVNIGTIKMYREHRGTKAFTILETDESVSSDIIEKIIENKHIYHVFSIVL